MTAILMHMHQNGPFYYYAVHVMPTNMKISNLKESIALTLSFLRMSSVANLSKLATRGATDIPQDPLPCWYSMEGKTQNIKSAKWLKFKMVAIFTTYCYSFGSFNTRKNKKKTKVENGQISKWCPIWHVCTTTADFNTISTI